MKKKRVILSLIIVFVLLFSGITAYAYFSTVKPFSHNVSYTVPDNYIQINTLDDFYREIDLYKDNQSTDFNSSSEVSTKRKTLILNSDLELTADAIITSDCHINLNGHTINLNGKRFNIKNTFAGTIAIFNTATQKAVITDSVGTNQVVIDTPNACVVIDKVHIDTTIDVVINAVSDEAVMESAIKLIYANIANDGVNDLYSTYSGLTAFLDPSRCILTAHAADPNTIGCVYTHTDLDLLDSFYNYDVAISYTSSNEGVLKTTGKVIVGTASDLSVLGVTVNYNGKTMTKNINVHVVAEADYESAAIMNLLAYIEKNYNPTLEGGKYEFTNGFDLPLSNTYFNTNYDYRVMEGTTEYLSADGDYFIKDEAKNPNMITVKLKPTITDLVIVSSNKTDANKKVEKKVPVKGKTNSVIDDNYAYCLGIINGLYSNQITIKESKENGVTFYNSVTLLTTTDPVKHSRLLEGSKIVNELKSNSDNTYRISPFDADNELLEVNPNSTVKPYLGQGVYISFTFTMKDNTNIVIQLPIIFEPMTETGQSGYQLFEPFYNFFSKKFDYSSKFEREYVDFEGHLYDSFSVPLFFNNEYPTYTFIIYERDKTSKSGYKIVDETKGLFKVQLTLPGKIVADMSSMTPSKLEQFKNNTQAKTRILIDPYKINIETTEYFFAYVSIRSVIENSENKLKYFLTVPTATGLDDIVGASLEEIKGKQEAINLDLNTFVYKNLLKLDGIVRTNSPTHTKDKAVEEFEDLEFYKYVYGLFYPKFDMTTYVEGKCFIKTADLNKDLEPKTKPTSDPTSDYRWTNDNFSLNLSADNTRTFTSLKGINHLKSITSLTLNRRNITSITGGNNNWVDQITYISQMTSLRVLDLSNTGIYDRLGNNNKMPQGTNNKFIQTLNALTNLEYLYLNNADGVNAPLNQIYEFAGVQKFTKLKILDVTGNKFIVPKKAGTDFLTQAENFIKRIFERIVNALYGSNGSTNKAYFAILRARNCRVLNGKEIPLDENSKIIVNALSSLEYQNKIKVGDDIEMAYAEYIKDDKNNPLDLNTKSRIFGLKSKYSEIDKNDKGEDSVKINYTLSEIKFVPVEPNPSPDPNAIPDGTIANGFEFTIVYTGKYQTPGIFLDWGTEKELKEPIEYTFYYEVERVS